MGLSPFSKCSGGYYATIPSAPAPNPNPGRWTLLEVYEYTNAYVLMVRYHDATNFEGVKVMIYKGKFRGLKKKDKLDPHFSEDNNSPIARFRPDVEGVKLAKELAKSL